MDSKSDTLLSENKKLKEELKELKQELAQSKKLSILGTMASSIAHEIKNPLVAVKTFFDLLPTKYEDEEFRGNFSLVVKREVERINELVTQLLDFARPKKPVFEKVQVDELVKHTLDLLSLQSKDTNVDVVTKESKEAFSVKADREQISRVFTNIALNSIQAMHNGGQLEISTLVNKTKVETRFSDNGPGITKENLEKIFEPFFSTKHKGSGLGLSICQQIVQDHNGEIKVKSTSSGTAFSIILPIYK